MGGLAADRLSSESRDLYAEYSSAFNNTICSYGLVYLVHESSRPQIRGNHVKPTTEQMAQGHRLIVTSIQRNLSRQSFEATIVRRYCWLLSTVTLAYDSGGAGMRTRDCFCQSLTFKIGDGLFHHPYVSSLVSAKSGQMLLANFF